jgi:transcriptional regulator with XRE-family HTH domain
MSTASQTAPQPFQSACRRWRQFRKLSQLDLALAANVSQRHVSWLETGRSRPSREMVVRLAEAMDIPLRERNLLLQSAGFAAAYSESHLDAPCMEPVLDALNHVLEHHEPLPAVVVDRFWNVRKQNRAAELMFSIAGDSADMLNGTGGESGFNLALLTLHPQGLRPFIVNWEQAAPAFIRRLNSEALASGDPQVRARFAGYIELAGQVADGDLPTGGLLPVLPLQLNINGLELSLFSVISTFGTPQDITTDELRIETFYPGDDKTAEFFRNTA